nr:MAG TPA: protein disulfide isomerase-like protein [Caudoviricetes sp.]
MSKSKASMTKDDYIKAEIKRLKKIFANLTQDASDEQEQSQHDERRLH